MKAYFRYMLSLVVLLVGTTGLAFSQNIVTGTVEDADGPLIGASVLVKGTTVGTITNMDGQFSIEAKVGDELEFSYMGYTSQTHKVTGKTLNVTMSENTEVLSEVVVTAMGIKRDRKALGYEVGEVKGEELTKAKETNVANSLAGRVAGLVVQGTAAGASGSTRVMLRGTTEMTGNNQPLYVIDGVPMDNTAFGSAGTEGGYDLGDGISAINPDDIESMSVLKGPAAAIPEMPNGEWSITVPSLLTPKPASGTMCSRSMAWVPMVCITSMPSATPTSPGDRKPTEDSYSAISTDRKDLS